MIGAQDVQALRFAVVGFEKVALGDSEGVPVVSSLASIPTGKDLLGAVFKAEVAEHRWRADGTSPTTTVGMLHTATDGEYFVPGESLADWEGIATSASAGAIVNVTYYGRTQ